MDLPLKLEAYIDVDTNNEIIKICENITFNDLQKLTSYILSNGGIIKDEDERYSLSFDIATKIKTSVNFNELKISDLKEL